MAFQDDRLLHKVRGKSTIDYLSNPQWNSVLVIPTPTLSAISHRVGDDVRKRSPAELVTQPIKSGRSAGETGGSVTAVRHVTDLVPNANSNASRTAATVCLSRSLSDSIKYLANLLTCCDQYALCIQHGPRNISSHEGFNRACIRCSRFPTLGFNESNQLG
jgi:hypothetical protein